MVAPEQALTWGIVTTSQRMLRKQDFGLLPVLATVYLFNALDKSVLMPHGDFPPDLNQLANILEGEISPMLKQVSHCLRSLL